MSELVKRGSPPQHHCLDAFPPPSRRGDVRKCACGRFYVSTTDAEDDWPMWRPSDEHGCCGIRKVDIGGRWWRRNYRFEFICREPS